MTSDQTEKLTFWEKVVSICVAILLAFLIISFIINGFGGTCCVTHAFSLKNAIFGGCT